MEKISTTVISPTHIIRNGRFCFKIYHTPSSTHAGASFCHHDARPWPWCCHASSFLHTRPFPSTSAYKWSHLVTVHGMTHLICHLQTILGMLDLGTYLLNSYVLTNPLLKYQIRPLMDIMAILMINRITSWVVWRLEKSNSPSNDFMGNRHQALAYILLIFHIPSLFHFEGVILKLMLVWVLVLDLVTSLVSQHGLCQWYSIGVHNGDESGYGDRNRDARKSMNP